jgi:Coenzyme PQQ synthesis protein D (PqqD)
LIIEECLGADAASASREFCSRKASAALQIRSILVSANVGCESRNSGFLLGGIGVTVHYSLNEEAVAQEDIDGEVIAINFITGAYFSLRDTAADIWRLVLSGASKEAIADAAVSASDLPEARKQVLDFLSELVALELLKQHEGQASNESEPVFVTPYTAPVIDKFEDMAEFIKLDPIHEVTSAGWPVAAR